MRSHRPAVCLLLLAVALLAGCGEVVSFTDAAVSDNDPKDAATTADGPACGDQTCGGATADGCCPAACNAASDADCDATCGNTVVEPGETCDPLASCPMACAQIGCQERILAGAGTCAAVCSNGGQETTCSPSTDGCCPAGCNASNDIDCAATCDNGEIEVGEQCDPLESCPTSCPNNACDTSTLFGEGTCGAQCVVTGSITECIGGDGCCPGGGFGACNSTNDSDCGPVCGNGTIESGENCEGAGCTCGGESYSCFAPIGGPDTCNIQCHVPAQECGAADACCPYVRGSGGESCNRSSDEECVGPAWRSVDFRRVNYGQGCTVVSIYGIELGASYLFTTCSPGLGVEDPGYGDPVITAVVDNNDRSYPVGNDDCGEPWAIPVLAGWSCNNNDGALRMSCASPNTGGFRILDEGVGRLDVTVCPFGGTAFGHAPFHVWFNGNDPPNPG